MKVLKTAALLLVAVGALSGCGDRFTDEEMHLGIEDKVRPYAVIVDPPEAAPGDTVQVTLHARAPHPADLDITWRVALDFDRGLYDVDEVERNFRALTAPPPSFDADGFLTQTFTWVVPDSALLYSSSIPDEIDDPALAGLTALLPGLGSGTTLRKTEVDAWLKARTADEVHWMDPDMQAATWAVADRFVCAVRFRATLRTAEVVDVTRNLTVRQTPRLGGPNANHNARIRPFELVAMQKKDAARSDIHNPDVAKTVYTFIDAQGRPQAASVEVPYHDSWTYYLRIDFYREDYASPWDPGNSLEETGTNRWYYFRRNAPADPQPFFVTDDGDDAEMWNLDEYVRLMPAGAGSTYRIVSVVRDYRNEWISFNVSPGTVLAEGLITYVAP